MKAIKNRGLGMFFLLPFLISMLFVACDKESIERETTSLTGLAYDAISFSILKDAEVRLIPFETNNNNSDASYYKTHVDKSGKYIFDEIFTGRYNITIEAEGYKTMSSSTVDLSFGETFVAFLPVVKDFPHDIGGITGVIVDQGNNPVPFANIAISAQDESITNGYFASATANEYGQFYIGAIPLSSTNRFKIRCIAENHGINIQEQVTILSNEMVVMNFEMGSEESFNTLFHEDFEGGTDGWERSGLWHVHSNSEIFNQAYPDYVKLAPNDTSEGRIPDAYHGSHAIWYGDPEKGNYLGSQSPYDNSMSGGTSVEGHSGHFISPVIDLEGQTEASLCFWTWFEIESVNPNQYGYDLMEVWILRPDKDDILLAKLNPYIDPIVPARNAIPFTSGGFNQAPVWKYEEIDLSDFTDGKIRLKFLFDTRDALYNGFRGWFIDEISVIDRGGASQLKSRPDSSTPLMERENH